MDQENKQSLRSNDLKLNDFLSAYKYPLVIGLVGTVLLIGGVISSGILPKTFNNPNTLGVKSTKVPSASIVTPLEIAVDVSGAVSSPGVYKLPAGSRVEEAINAAGGVTDLADPNFVAKNLNLAQKISDGMKIYVPKANESGASGAISSASTLSTNSGPININEASLSDLDKLSGVGPVTAQKIIEGRPYGSIEELVTKKVISRSVYEKIKDSVSVY